VGLKGKARQTRTTTEEEIRILGPLDVLRRGGRMKELTVRIPERSYTGLRRACSRLERHARENDVTLKKEITPESLLEVLVYWYVSTDGEPDLMGRLEDV